jgi:putative secretion ATPase (PEP-CTERM system associated)
MYERFYDLRERPFALSPDPDYLYPSRVHREALDYLRYGLETHAGFVVITGEIGSGKTTLLQTLLRGLDSHTTVGRIVNTMLDPRELLETIMLDLGLDPAGKSKPLLLRDLAQYLVDQRLAGRMVLLVIDEAQNLSPAALEELRMLSNLETEKSKLLQIALIGQPNLREKLSAPELEQLRQRITVSYHLEPLDAVETGNYINHRLRRAAIHAPLEFPRDVTDAVHARSRGVPRIVNVICDAALVFGYAEERRQIDLPLIHEVLGELEATGVLPRTERAAAPRPVEPTPRPMGVPDAAAAPMGRQAGASHAVAEQAVGRTVTAAVPQPGAAERLSEQILTRTAQLDEREQMLRQRERELAEQRRILAEEYRLLRARHASPAPEAVAPAARSFSSAGSAAPAGQNFSSGAHAGRNFSSAGHAGRNFSSAGSNQGFWGWVKRVMLGSSAPTVEGS